MDGTIDIPKKDRSLSRCLSDVRTKIFSVFVLAVFVGLVIPYILSSYHEQLLKEKNSNGKCILEQELRIDCQLGSSESEQSQSRCEIAGCCWQEHDSEEVPRCFHPHPSPYTYNVKKIDDSNGTGYRLDLEPNFQNCTVLGDSTGTSSRTVRIDVRYLGDKNLHLVVDGRKSEKPLDPVEVSGNRSKETDVLYDVKFPRNGRFSLTVSRKDNEIGSKTNPALFNTFYGPMVVCDGYAELTTLIPSFNLYGIGQSRKKTYRHDLTTSKRHVLFSRADAGRNGSEQFSTGVHPFYMVLEKTGKAHGVLIRTGAPMEIITGGAPSVTFRISDSKLDFHIFLGPTPADVVRQLTDVIGRPAIPPYWALGYHSCRSTTDLESVADWLKFSRGKRIPHESDCISSELLSQASRDIHSVANLTSSLKMSHRKLVTFVTPHVPLDILEHLNQSDYGSLFIRSPSGRFPFIGHSSDEQEVVYPDFFNERDVEKWYTDHFRNVSVSVNYDGVVLDQNTPTNIRPTDAYGAWCRNVTDVFTFFPGTGNTSDGTVCMDAVHFNGELHLHYHNMYGYKHTKLVSDIHRESLKRRPFLCSLSTFPGSGKYGCHWSGQVSPSWESLKESVVQTLDFSLFGIPMFGVPPCGTGGPIRSELCSRWLQLAAFQPLLMTHRTDGTELLQSHRRLTTVGRSVVQLRYSLLPYLYSLFQEAKRYGRTVVRPLFFEFPEIEETHGIDEQFMWGSGLMISPILEESAQKNKAFFPPGCWYDYYTGRMEARSEKGLTKELPSVENHVNLHIRGGHAIPSQNAKLTTYDSRRQNFSLFVALDCPKDIDRDVILAAGEVFIHDGVSMGDNDDDGILVVSVNVNSKFLSLNPQTNNFDSKKSSFSTVLNKIHLYGVNEKPSSCTVDNVRKDVLYNSIFESLVLNDLNLDLRKNHTIQCE